MRPKLIRLAFTLWIVLNKICEVVRSLLTIAVLFGERLSKISAFAYAIPSTF